MLMNFVIIYVFIRMHLCTDIFLMQLYIKKCTYLHVCMHKFNERETEKNWKREGEKWQRQERKTVKTKSWKM